MQDFFRDLFRSLHITTSLQQLQYTLRYSSGKTPRVAFEIEIWPIHLWFYQRKKVYWPGTRPIICAVNVCFCHQSMLYSWSLLTTNPLQWTSMVTSKVAITGFSSELLIMLFYRPSQALSFCEARVQKRGRIVRGGKFFWMNTEITISPHQYHYNIKWDREINPYSLEKKIACPCVVT